MKATTGTPERQQHDNSLAGGGHRPLLSMSFLHHVSLLLLFASVLVNTVITRRSMQHIQVPVGAYVMRTGQGLPNPSPTK